MSIAFLKKFIFGNKNRLEGGRSKKTIWSTRGGGVEKFRYMPFSMCAKYFWIIEASFFTRSVCN